MRINWRAAAGATIPFAIMASAFSLFYFDYGRIALALTGISLSVFLWSMLYGVLKETLERRK